jgi:hypothetical protein
VANAVSAQCSRCGHVEIIATAGHAVRLPDGTYYPLPPREKLAALRDLGLDPKVVRQTAAQMRWARWRCDACGLQFDRYFSMSHTGCTGCALPLLGLVAMVWALPLHWVFSAPLGLIVGTGVLAGVSRRREAKAAAARPDLPTPEACPRCDGVHTRPLGRQRQATRCDACGQASLIYRPLRRSASKDREA